MVEKLTTKRVTERLVPVFQAAGYDGASLEMLAKAAGLTRGSLYHHFPGGKQAMAAAVLARSGLAMTQYILQPLKQTGSADSKISAMLDGVLHYYAGDPPICLMNVLTLGQGAVLFGAVVHGAVSAWHSAIVTVYRGDGMALDRANAKATEILSTIQGSLVLARVAGQRTVFERSIAQLKAAL